MGEKFLEQLLPASLRVLVLRTQHPHCEEAQTSPHRETTWDTTSQREPARPKPQPVLTPAK